jgi:chemotaxis protein methyltransferase CheR
VRDRACSELLEWAATEVGLRPAGFRRVRQQVCKRLLRRMVDLRLPGPTSYRAFVAAHPEERVVIEALCRVHVSRFHRDRPVFDALRARVLPAVAAAAGNRLRVWSAGCAAGEEPYTIALIWQVELGERFPGTTLELLATDADPDSLARARRGCYPPSSLRELPRAWQERAFVREGRWVCLKPELRRPVEFRQSDLRHATPAGPFHLILCRNLAFTYFAESDQRAVASRLESLLAPGGALLIGARERLPEARPDLAPDPEVPGLFWSRRIGTIRPCGGCAPRPCASPSGRR